jgi:HEXXH motif-containing protein
MPDRLTRDRIFASIEWSRMAEPQVDAYDTRSVLRLADTLRHGHSVAATSIPASAGSVWFDVAPVYAGRPAFERHFGRYRAASATHPNVARAVSLVDRWPCGSAQARSLIRVLHAALDPEVEDDVGWNPDESSSHSYEDAIGTMWATVHSSVGLAEAIVHEMAHHKLRACGVRFETAECLVANLPGERYPSPILNGRKRPMPAILHAHYALLHMIALEIAILAARVAPAMPLVRGLLRRHLNLVIGGDITLRRYLVVDEYGADFIPALRRWQTTLVGDADVYL